MLIVIFAHQELLIRIIIFLFVMFAFSPEFMKDACQITEDSMDFYLFVKAVEMQIALNQTQMNHVTIKSLKI